MTNHKVLLLVRPAIPSIRQGIDKLANECGWLMRIESIDAPPKDWQGDGVLLFIDGEKAKGYVKRLRRQRIPVVAISDEWPDVNIHKVTGDDVEIGRLAARHFNERNFTHAVFFSVETDSTCHDLRHSGFRERWEGKTLDAWIWPRESAARHHKDWQRMQAWLIKKLRKAPKPLAVFAWNDYDAAYVLNACLQAGVNVPNDVAILGVDNYTMICEHQSVKLSSIVHNLKRIGYVGAAMLERLMSGGRVPRKITRIKPHGIITRESTDALAVYDDELRPAITYIDEHLSHAFGAAEIAAALNISRGRLDRLFTAKLGHSVGTEIAAHRIAKAKKLLTATRLPIEAISEACGYCNRSFFSKRFRKATGTTPLAWRKRES